MATFKCLQSGQTVTFTQPHDIESMRLHSGYVRVEDKEVVSQETKDQSLDMRRPGRPRRVENVGD